MSGPGESGLIEKSSIGRRRGDAIAALAPIIFLLLWSSGFGVAKVGLQYVQPLTFLMLRYGVIVLIFVPVFLIVRPPLPRAPMIWLHIGVVGFLIQFVYFGLAYIGMGLGVSTGVAAVMASTQPLAVALAAPWLAHERVGVRRWVGLLLGAAGATGVIAANSSLDAKVDGDCFSASYRCSEWLAPHCTRSVLPSTCTPSPST